MIYIVYCGYICLVLKIYEEYLLYIHICIILMIVVIMMKKINKFALCVCVELEIYIKNEKFYTK